MERILGEMMVYGGCRRKRQEVYRRVKARLKGYGWEDLYGDGDNREGSLRGIGTVKGEREVVLHEGEGMGGMVVGVWDVGQTMRMDVWDVYGAKVRDLEEEIEFYEDLLWEYAQLGRMGQDWLQVVIEKRERLLGEFYKDIFDERKVRRLCKEICDGVCAFLDDGVGAYRND